MIGNDALSSCISYKANRPSLTADCICQWKALRSLVAWDEELCHLQYACRFSSSSGGMAWDNLMFPLLSNSSNMRSQLETSKLKRSCPCRFLGIGLSYEQEYDLASDGHTNSAIFFFSSSESDSQLTYVLDWWVSTVSFAFLNLNSKPMALICKWLTVTNSKPSSFANHYKQNLPNLFQTLSN